MVKPGSFFVGVIDLFSIFLPGGLLTFVLFQQHSAFISEVAPIRGDQYWAVFLFSSYLIGHIIFMMGSKIDILYNYHRERRNPYLNETAFQCTSKIKKKFLNEVEREAINNYQWATSILTTHYPEAMMEVDRLVGNSKFFRSLIIILPLISAIYAFGDNYLHAGIVISVVIPCYMRYYDQRLKSTTRAYQYVVMLSGLGKLEVPD